MAGIVRRPTLSMNPQNKPQDDSSIHQYTSNKPFSAYISMNEGSIIIILLVMDIRTKSTRLFAIVEWAERWYAIVWSEREHQQQRNVIILQPRLSRLDRGNGRPPCDMLSTAKQGNLGLITILWSLANSLVGVLVGRRRNSRKERASHKLRPVAMDFASRRRMTGPLEWVSY